MPCAIAKVRTALQQNDRVASKAVLVRQVGANRGWDAVAKLVERALNASPFQLGNWHRSLLLAGAV
jgi:hypothetical protein